MSTPSEPPPPRTSTVRVKIPGAPTPGAGPAQDAPTTLPPAHAAPRPMDEYEARYMAGGRSLARSKKPMPWWFHVMILLAVLAAAGSGVATGQLVPLLMTPVMLLAWLLFTHLRLTVTAEKVYVQLGVFGPTIPIERVESARAERYNAFKYGGWGIRRSLDGSRAFSVPGGTGMAVRIEYRTERGARRTVVVSSNEAEQVAVAIEQARAAAARGGGGVRVAAATAVASAEGPARVGPARSAEELERGGGDARTEAPRDDHRDRNSR